MTEVAPGAPPRPRWDGAGWALVLAALALGFWAFPLKTIGLTGDHLPGDLADNRLNNYILEHGYRYLTGREASFWDAPMLYPTGGATTTSDAHLGMLPAYAALRAVGLSPEGAFQGYFLIPFVLNFAAAAWAIRRLGFGPTAAAVGAYLFAYGLPVAGQLAHVQLFPRFLVPPAAVFGWEYLRAPRAWRWGAVVGCVVGQVYLSVYIGFLLLLLLAAGFTVVAILCRTELNWRELLRPGRRTGATRVATALVGMLALLPLLARHAGAVPATHIELLRQMAPRPGAWLTPPVQAAAFPELAAETELGPVGEQQLLPGVLTLAALPGGLMLAARTGRLGARGASLAVAAWTVAALALLLTRIEGVWLYELFARLPGAGSIRAPGRVVLVLLFPAGVVLGGCAEALVGAVGRVSRWAAAGAAVAAVGAVAADHWLVPTSGPHGPKWGMMRSPKETTVRRQAAIGAAIRRHPAPTLVYVFPSFGVGSVGGTLGVQCEAMRAAQDAGVPCVNGWSGYLPPSWDFFPGYRPLFAWLAETGAPPDAVAGLVVVGEPTPDANLWYEAVMRAAYPPSPPAPER